MPSKQTEPSLFQRSKAFVKQQILNYEMNTGSWGLEPWEKLVYNGFVFSVLLFGAYYSVSWASSIFE